MARSCRQHIDVSVTSSLGCAQAGQATGMGVPQGRFERAGWRSPGGRSVLGANPRENRQQVGQSHTSTLAPLSLS